MNGLRVPSLSALLVLPLAVGLSAAGEMPDEFTNLTVLPKDIGKREMLATMREYSRALGVACDHCHVKEGEGENHQEDFVSDALEPKRVARGMIKMMQEINAKLPAATGRGAPMQMRCVTCHRGLVQPEGLDQILLATVAEQGVPVAIERYGELRKKYYGSGSYDFRPRLLNDVAERVAEGEDVEGAIRLVRLNLEQDPDLAASHVLLGKLLAAKGDRSGAIASLERALAIDPNTRGAKQALATVRAAE